MQRIELAAAIEQLEDLTNDKIIDGDSVGELFKASCDFIQKSPNVNARNTAPTNMTRPMPKG